MRIAVLLFGMFLVLWGNLMQLLIGATAVLPGGSWSFVGAGVVLSGVSLIAARALGLGAASLGLSRSGILRGSALGLVAGGAIGAAGVGMIHLAPFVLGVPLVYGAVSSVSRDDLVRHLVLFLPLGAVIPEEVAFRGTLLGAMLRVWGPHVAVVAAAWTFALWHLVVAVLTVASTNLGQLSTPVVPGVLGALVVLFVGGIIIAVLRLTTGALASSIAAHWAFNAVILVGLWTARS